MARRKKNISPEEDEPALDISSLIDVCFLLLIYFLVTSTIQPKENDLALKLPSSDPSENQDKPDIEPMLLLIKADGSVYEKLKSTGEETSLAGASSSAESARELGNLDTRLDEYVSAISGATKPLLQVSVEPTTKQQFTVDVMNSISKAGITSVTFTDLN